MEYIEIDHEIFGNQIGEVGAYSIQAREIFSGETHTSLSAGFSEVPGLDQMGAAHGLVVDGGAGSAVETLQKYADQVAWLRDGLRATQHSLTSQEDLVDHAMQIADEGGVVGEEMTLFPDRPDQNFVDFDFASPSVSIPSSLSELSAAFAATDGAAVAASAASWAAMAKNAASLAESLRMTAWDIAEINKADSINAAVDKALAVADAADVFSKNAGVMSTSVEYLGQVAATSALHVGVAELSVALIPDPVEREAAEQAFLHNFMGVQFPIAVESAVPQIRNLMSMEQGDAGGGALHTSMGQVDGEGRPGPVARINAGTQMLEQLIDNPRNLGSGSFNQVAQAMEQLIEVGGAGEGSNLGEAGTGIASVANAPGLIGANGGTVGGAAASGSGLGGAGAMGLANAGAAVSGIGAGMGLGVSRAGSGAAGGLGGAGGAGAFGRVGGAGAGSVAGGTGAGAFGPVGSGASAGSGASGGARGMGRGMGSGGIGGVGGATAAGNGAGGTSGLRGAGGAGAMGVGTGGGAGSVGGRMPGGMTSGGMAAGGVGHAPGGSAGAQGGAHGRGMMPMGAAPVGQQQEAKRGKVKTVTSQVEEEGNISSLLGDLPQVVPGPIGAWARG